MNYQRAFEQGTSESSLFRCFPYSDVHNSDSTVIAFIFNVLLTEKIIENHTTFHWFFNRERKSISSQWTERENEIMKFEQRRERQRGKRYPMYMNCQDIGGSMTELDINFVVSLSYTLFYVLEIIVRKEES